MSAQGWSTEKRKQAILEILDHLIRHHGFTATEAHRLLANRVGVGINTVQGWASEGEGSRAPPLWPIIDLLNYELGLAPVRPLLGADKRKPARVVRLAGGRG